LATRGGDARAEKRVVDERRRARASGSGLRTAKLDAFDDANLVHVGPDKTGRPPAGSPSTGRPDRDLRSLGAKVIGASNLSAVFFMHYRNSPEKAK